KLCAMSSKICLWWVQVVRAPKVGSARVAQSRPGDGRSRFGWCPNPNGTRYQSSSWVRTNGRIDAMDHTHHTRLTPADLSHDRVVGAPIYGPGDEKVGTISSLEDHGNG